MRIPEAKIREALTHPEKLVRDEVLHYFSDCYSPDPDVMPAAIQAIERYGREDAFSRLYPLENLKQTEPTVQWIIRELKAEDQKTSGRPDYTQQLTRILCEADPELLAPRADEIFNASGFNREKTRALQDWLTIAPWSADRCWKELERLSTEWARDPDAEHNYRYASQVVRTLARRQDKATEQKLLDLFAQDVEPSETNPMIWMEVFLAELAGEMRLGAAVPLLVKRLNAPDDVMPEDCEKALAKIGTDAAAAAITDNWAARSWDYRLFASTALENIHTDTTVRKCLELLPTNMELNIRTHLASALLSQFAEESIEPVRQMVEQEAYDTIVMDLKGKLVAVSTVVGVSFPELSAWKHRTEEKRAQIEKRMKEMDASFNSPLPPLPAPAWKAPMPGTNRIVREETRVGRNDPCPCGSGKKFKKCCMKDG
jgi:hypothetical protein